MKTTVLKFSLMLGMTLSLTACPNGYQAQNPPSGSESGSGGNNDQGTPTTTLPGSTTTTTLPGVTTTTSTTSTTTTSTTQPLVTTTTTTMPDSGPGACTTLPGDVAAGTIVINQGAATTNSSSVTLALKHYEALRMKISNDDHCGCGAFEAYSPSKVWTLTALNQQATVSVQFEDYEHRYTKCAVARILHDDKAPEITLSLDPSNSYETGKNTQLNLSVVDTGVGVQSVSCTLNNQATNCSAGASTLVFANSAEGTYQFNVSATDKLGQSSSKTISWTVKTPYQQITQDYLVQSNNKVDILIIDDNSGSMEYEQKSMAQRMSTFLSQLSGLDWRIAITTTDPRPDAIGGEGQLLEMTGLKKQYFISSSMNSTTAQQALSATIQRPEVGSGDEQGILATYRAIERSLAAASNPNKDFFRNDANFAAVVISDEDESATGFKNKPENLLNLVKTTWPSKNFAFHSIITRPGDAQCKATEGYAYGPTYEQMSRLTGAGMIGGPIIGSVCEADYGSQLKGIGASVQAMQKVIPLKCNPVGNPHSGVVVLLNGANYTAPYTVQNDRLVFESNLPTGQYTLQYQCK